MKWIPDETRRFKLRPHYQPGEIDQLCEHLIVDFTIRRHGSFSLPIATSDLTVLIEEHTEDFDSCCDLEEGVEGLTDFEPLSRPKVKVSSRLSKPNLENRLRTTLTHEFAHVRFHGSLFGLEEGLKNLFDGLPKAHQNRCNRESMTTSQRDWMEWQASYASSAFLMPQTALRALVTSFREERGHLFADLGTQSELGLALVARVSKAFQVSGDAARVRLEQLRFITPNPKRSLF